MFAGLLASHLDIAAEEHKRETVIGITTPEAEEPWAETETEDFHLNVEGARRPKMSQFVNQDHDPDEYQQPPGIQQERKSHRGIPLCLGRKIRRCEYDCLGVDHVKGHP